MYVPLTQTSLSAAWEAHEISSPSPGQEKPTKCSRGQKLYAWSPKRTQNHKSSSSCEQLFFALCLTPHVFCPAPCAFELTNRQQSHLQIRMNTRQSFLSREADKSGNCVPICISGYKILPWTPRCPVCCCCDAPKCRARCQR